MKNPKEITVTLNLDTTDFDRKMNRVMEKFNDLKAALTIPSQNLVVELKVEESVLNGKIPELDWDKCRPKKSVDKLLELDKTLEIIKLIDGGIGVRYTHGDPCVFGRGKTFDEACDAYCNKIAGRTLLFDAGTYFQTKTTMPSEW